MADRIVLHIGAPKTGTTFLQAMLFGHSDRLRRRGVLVPGESRASHGKAAAAVCAGFRSRSVRYWRQLVEASRSWPGTVVVSNEWFAMASAENAAAAIEELGVDHTHLLFTVKGFDRQIPSAWQERLKLGFSDSLEDFCASLDREEGRWRWSVLDGAAVLDRWRGRLPVEQVHVVTVPRNGSDRLLLWRRFLSACDIDDGAEWETHTVPARESLSAESAALLQRLGPLLREAIEADSQSWRESYRWIQRYLAHGLLLPRRGSPTTLRPAEAQRLRARSRRCAERLSAAGYDIVGDLSDLLGEEAPPGARHPADVQDRELLAIAIPLVADLLREVRAQSRQAARPPGG